MTTIKALNIWNSKNRKMGCVSAIDWFCKRVDGFFPLRKTFIITSGKYIGESYQHVVATNGMVEIDLARYANKPKEKL